jgi:hypothetical protein
VLCNFSVTPPLHSSQRQGFLESFGKSFCVKFLRKVIPLIAVDTIKTGYPSPQWPFRLIPCFLHSPIPLGNSTYYLGSREKKIKKKMNFVFDGKTS